MPSKGKTQRALMAANTKCARLAWLATKVIDAHASVVMDTPEERDLHDRAVQVFRDYLRVTLGYPPEAGVEAE